MDYEFMYDLFFKVIEGIPVTLSITLISMVISIPIAFFFAYLFLDRSFRYRKIISIYVSFVRGTPVILQILIIYSLMPSLLNIIVINLGLNINVFEINPIYYAYIIFTINTTAILIEVFRSGIGSVSDEQLEAGLSIGMSKFLVYKRIIIPQVFVNTMPNLCNTTINLVKSTSLAFAMTVQDITAIAKIEASYGYNYIEAYLVIYLIYIIICTLIQFGFSLLEKNIGAYRKISS
ncbi:MAG: amino acid ABC transporter permease [Lachnospirales bacterium]